MARLDRSECGGFDEGEGISRLDGEDFWIEEYRVTPPNTASNGPSAAEEASEMPSV